MHACMLANAAELPAVAEHAEKVAHALLQVVAELDPGAQRSSRRSERPSDCPLSHHDVDMISKVAEMLKANAKNHD